MSNVYKSRPDNIRNTFVLITPVSSHRLAANLVPAISSPTLPFSYVVLKQILSIKKNCLLKCKSYYILLKNPSMISRCTMNKIQTPFPDPKKDLSDLMPACLPACSPHLCLAA